MSVGPEKFIDLLKDAVERIIKVASDHKLGPELPSIQYEIAWMEPTSESHSVGKHEVRSQRSFLAVWQTLERELQETDEIRALFVFVKEFIETRGKFFSFFGGGRDHLAVQLLFIYFELTGTICLDLDAIKKIAGEFVSDLTSDDADAAAVLHVVDFVAETSFALD